MEKIEKVINSLSPHERKILPYLKENISEICKKSNLDRVSVTRALEYLKNKKILSISYEKSKIVEIGVNGAFYKKNGLPERKLLNLLNEKSIIALKDAQKQASLSNDEFKASIGVLKNRSIIEIKNGKIILNANREEISKKTPEEIFLEEIPLKFEGLTKEQNSTLRSLLKRKDIIQIKENKKIKLALTELGRKIISYKINHSDSIEAITPEILKKETLWRNKNFRRYDTLSPVPEIHGGKRHFVNQAVDYARKIWVEMGFKEMTGNLAVSSFWNFDALFTAQDHPVREMQDTFFIDKKEELPEKRIVEAVKKSHEDGISGSKGWQYRWSDEEAKKIVLRTHTTCLSSQTLATLKKNDFPAKFFAIGKCFRNESLDWSHGFEFNQTEGIVVDKNANFQHLIYYLREFFRRMGFEKVRLRPSYFPYTEPSIEIDIFHPTKKKWLELGGAGIFRPEVVVPLLGENIPVLAWGPGFDRMIMDYYEIKDLREMYENNLTKLRQKKFWMK